MENVPEKAWNDLILGNRNEEFEFLALKILLKRVQEKVSFEPTPGTVSECVKEVKDLFRKYGKLASAKRDLEKILNSKSVA